MAETLVADASPIILLAKVARLDLLGGPGCTVLVPGAVAREVCAGPPEDPARQAVDAGWAQRRDVESVPREIVEWGLGAGESEVIALARIAGAVAVLDDAQARSCARSLGVATIGTLGLVLRAAVAKRIPAAGPVLVALRGAGIHLDDATIREAVAAIGEAWPPAGADGSP